MTSLPVVGFITPVGTGAMPVSLLRTNMPVSLRTKNGATVCCCKYATSCASFSKTTFMRAYFSSVSLPGRMGIHSTSRFVAISLRRGSMEMTRTFFCSMATNRS